MKQADRALEADDPEAEARATAAFHRAARSVRQCIALEAKLVRDAARAEREDAQYEAAAERPSAWRRGPLAQRPAQAAGQRYCRQVIVAEAGEYDFRTLLDNLKERLADGEDDADFADAPISELVARICRDLGVAPVWSLWEDDDWAIEEAREKPPARPTRRGRSGWDRRTQPGQLTTTRRATLGIPILGLTPPLISASARRPRGGWWG